MRDISWEHYCKAVVEAAQKRLDKEGFKRFETLLAVEMSGALYLIVGELVGIKWDPYAAYPDREMPELFTERQEEEV